MPYTLLLADDSVTIQRVIELTFADEDIDVVAVSDGDQAIERLNASPPDIVLADIGMPGRNGYEVAQYVKQTPSLAHIPVVLLTGAFEPVDQVRAAEAGCDGVLAKPFEPQLVIGRVKELLARPRHAAAEAAEPPVPVADRPVQPLSDRPVPPAPTMATRAPSPVPAGELNDYFDRLDEAFAKLGGPQSPMIAPPPAVPDEIDWFGTDAGGVPAGWDLPTPAAPGPADLPLTHVAPDSPVPPPVAPPAPVAIAAVASAPVAAPVEPVAPSASVAPLVPVPASLPSVPPKPVTLPSLADAFAALLAAEQTDARPLMAPAWPASAPSSPAVTEDVLEQITRRVLDRLSDRVVHDTVADVVSSIAERLVGEEIERIKASIK